MPKQKTKSAAKKRFKVSGAGKILRRHSMRSHNLEHKSAKRKRSFRRAHEVVGGHAETVNRLLGRR